MLRCAFGATWLGVLLVLLIVAPNSQAEESYNVLWIYPSIISDFSFSYLLDRARNDLIDIMDSRNVSFRSKYIEATEIDSCNITLETHLTEGLDGAPYDLVIGGGSVYTPCLEALHNDSRWPDLKLLVIGAGTPKERLGVISLYSYHTSFIQGYLCASVTQSDVVGIIVSTRVQSSKSVSAFALGAKQANSNVKVVVGMVNNLGGPVAGRKATEVMIKDTGMDCATNQLTIPGPNIAMQENDLYSNGYGVDTRIWSNDPKVLSSSTWNPLPWALPAYEMLANGSWTPFWQRDADFRTGGIRITPLSPLLKPSLMGEVGNLARSLQNGSKRVFCGPYWAETEFATPETMEYTPEGEYCMKEVLAKQMINFSDKLVSVVVEYHNPLDPIELTYIKFTDTAAIVLYVITTCVLVAMIFNFFHILVYRNHPTYVAASPAFLLIALFGLMVVVTSHYIRVGIPTNRRCMSRIWLVGLGFSISTACITARLWRVWKTHASSSLRGARIQVASLIPKFLAGFLAVQLTALLIFTLGDPLDPMTWPSSGLHYDELDVMCMSKRPGNSRFGFTLWITCTCLTLLPVAIMVFVGRRAKREYTDSLPTIVLMYFLVCVMLLSIIAIWGPTRSYLTRFNLEYITLVAAVGFWIALIAPKVYTTFKTGSSEESSALALTSFSAPRFSSQVRRSSVIHTENSTIDTPSLHRPE